MRGIITNQKPSRSPLTLFIAGAIAIMPSLAMSDFAPLAVGNKWVYTGSVDGGGNRWNPRLSHSVNRTIIVDSVHNQVEGSEWFLTYHDSLYKRAVINYPAHSSTPNLPDSLIKGRFRVIDRMQSALLQTLPFGTDYLPPEMNFFFRAHSIEAKGDFASVSSELYHTRSDTSAYENNKGLVYHKKYYDVWNAVAYTPPYLGCRFQLVSFTGTPTGGGGKIKLNPASWVGDFAPMVAGNSWKWHAHRRQVMGSGSNDPGNSSYTQYQDSLVRAVRIVSAWRNLSNVLMCNISIWDSVFAITNGGMPQADYAQKKDITIPCEGGGEKWPFTEFSSGSGQADIRRHFNLQHYPEYLLEDYSLLDTTLKAFVLREGMPGLFTDTMVYAQGIGFIRRAKLLFGTNGMTDRMEYELVEFNGKPIKAIPLGIKARSHREGYKNRLFRPTLTTDALGRFQLNLLP